MGAADDGIPASEITAFETALGRAAVDHDLVVYPDAPHGFFDASNEGFADACADAWRRTPEFIERHG
jgi:carboxymethylenebutenolidase